MKCNLIPLLPAASALKLLVPLYIYPLPDAWAPLVTAIEAHPSMPFQIIVNPNSGPGSDTFPDTTYAAAIAQLRAYSNVELVGYVHVLWGSRDSSEVAADIDKYAGWTSYTGADISVDGIFFDEAPNVSDETVISYMETLSLHAQQVIAPSSSSPVSNSTTPSSETITIFNMGTAPETTKYFDIGSQVVVMEWAYSDYSSEALADAIPDGYAAQSSVILHGFSGDSTALSDFFSAAQNLGIETAYATADCCYNSIDAVSGSGGIQAVADAFASVAA